MQAMKGLQAIEPDEKRCFTLPVTSRNHEMFRNLHLLVNLPPPPSLEDIPFDEIAETNYKRFYR